MQTQREELDRLLDALGPAEPPSDLLTNVMRQVKVTTPAAATSLTAMPGHRDNLTIGVLEYGDGEESDVGPGRSGGPGVDRHEVH